MSSSIDYSKLLENYNSEIVSEARDMAKDFLIRYVANYERNKEKNPGIYNFYKNLFSEKLDMFAFEMITQGIIEDPIACKDFVEEKTEAIFWNVNSRREYLKPVVDRYSKKGEINYEVACGSSPLFASLIYENLEDRTKLFLVDPVIYEKREPIFRKFGVRLCSHVEDFRKINGTLFAKVFDSSKKSVDELEVPEANVLYLFESLEFLSRLPDRPLNAKVDKDGVLPFVRGVSEIVRDDGKLVFVDYNHQLANSLPKFSSLFKLHEYRDLVNTKYPEGDYRLREFVLTKRI